MVKMVKKTPAVGNNYKNRTMATA